MARYGLCECMEVAMNQFTPYRYRPSWRRRAFGLDAAIWRELGIVALVWAVAMVLAVVVLIWGLP